MTHARDQWFRIYRFAPGEAGPVVDSKTKAVQAGWIKKPVWERASDVEHVHHPDAYHPDPRIAIAHHRKMMKTGRAVAACGLEHDPRLRFIETEGKPKKPCAECVKATEAATKDHAIALAELERVAAEKKAEREKEPTPADFDQEEIPTGH